MQGTIVTKIANNVMTLLGKFANKAGNENYFIKRSDKTKISPEIFVKVLISGCFSSVTATLSEFAQLFKQAGIKVTKQGVHERFNIPATNLMAALFVESLREFQSAKNEVFEILKPFSSVQLLDSSFVSLPTSMKKLFRGFGGAASEAALKIQTLYDFTQGQVKDIFFTSGRENDQGFTGHLASIEENALYLQDLGYFRIASFVEIQAKNAYFLSRLFGQTILYNEDGAIIDLAQKLKKAGNFLSLNVLIGSEHKLPVRLIAQRLPTDAVSKRLRKIHEAAAKNGNTPKKITLILAQWSICVTNVPKTILKDIEVYKIYAVRWQIELFFKLCKHGAGINKIRSTKPDRILCEIYARLIGVMMLLHICWPIRFGNKGERELSFPQAYEKLRKWAVLFFKALKSSHRLTVFLQEFLSELQMFAMKDIKRKKPATYQTLMNLGNKKRNANKQQSFNNRAIRNAHETKLAA